MGLFSTAENRTVAAEWRELGSSELPAVIKFVSGNLTANYEKLKTWTGQFELIVEADSGFAYLPLEKVKSRERKSGPSGGQRKKVPGDYVHVVRLKGRFELDLLADSVYSEHATIGSVEYRDKKSDTVYEIDISGDDENQRSILVGQEFLRLEPRSAISEVEGIRVKGDLSPSGSRVIVRDERKKGEQLGRYSDFFDPRQLLGHGKLPFEKMFRNFSQVLEKRNAQSTIRVFESQLSGSLVYRVVQAFPTEVVLSCIVDSAQGFNVTSYEIHKKVTKPFETVFVDYEDLGDIYLPKVYSLLKYNDNGNVRYTRKVEIAASKVNGGFDKTAFGLQRLEPAPGDRLNDAIEGKRSVYSGTEFVSPAQFRSKFTAAPSDSILAWLVLPILLGLILATVALILYRRRRQGNCAILGSLA
jgi:hypothetical protein